VTNSPDSLSNFGFGFAITGMPEIGPTWIVARGDAVADGKDTGGSIGGSLAVEPETKVFGEGGLSAEEETEATGVA